jgi:hypothetical protein
VGAAGVGEGCWQADRPTGWGSCSGRRPPVASRPRRGAPPAPACPPPACAARCSAAPAARPPCQPAPPSARPGPPPAAASAPPCRPAGRVGGLVLACWLVSASDAVLQQQKQKQRQGAVQQWPATRAGCWTAGQPGSRTCRAASCSSIRACSASSSPATADCRSATAASCAASSAARPSSDEACASSWSRSDTTCRARCVWDERGPPGAAAVQGWLKRGRSSTATALQRLQRRCSL